MAMFTAEKAIKAMDKTPLVLKYILKDLTNDQAKQLAATAQGWNALEVMCHMADFEDIFFSRAKRMIAENKPEFPQTDPDGMAVQHDYANQDIHDMYERFAQRRAEFIAFLKPLQEEEWSRRGVHFSAGVITVLELATNMGLHDLNHLAQMTEALG
ncbi:MAG: DinB family protein [Chloroflexi bacterium]|nr:DinB family protein [Chloroflexota bacterium]MCC6893033.1 DinB family protein [Anaerolineae bacterium]